MTATATRTPPDHGTYARYRGDKRRGIAPCHLDCCRDAYNRYRKRRDLLGPFSYDAAPVAAHLQRLIAAGATQQSIADAAHCHRTQVEKILHGRRKTVFAGTRARLLAVGSAAHDKALVDATGATRRLRALIAIGHPVSAIIAESGVNKMSTSWLISGTQKQVTARTARAVADAYGRMRSTPGASVFSVNRAAREGWPPPAGWEDLDLDGPATVPHDLTVRERTAEELVEDAEFIVATDRATWQHAAERLDVDVNTLHTYRSRVQKRTEANAGGAA
jgi:DNA-binding CsgD family transcriptional regulator